MMELTGVDEPEACADDEGLGDGALGRQAVREHDLVEIDLLDRLEQRHVVVPHSGVRTEETEW